jgi:hypothetical protein
LEGLNLDAQFWEEEKLKAILDDDIEMFNEYENQYQETLKSLNAMQKKLDVTVAQFEVEKLSKQTRETEAATKEALADFDRRSGERKASFNTLNGELDTAKAALAANLKAIEDL